MKCELCHKADAERAIRRTVGGEEQELYVCTSCAREASREKQPQREASGESPRPPSPEAGEAPLPLMGMILDAAFEIVDMDGQRIDKILVSRVGAEPAGDVTGSG